MSPAARLAELYRLAALAEPRPEVRRGRVRDWLAARDQASTWTRFAAWAQCWDLDKTDRARVQRELDWLTIERGTW